MTRSGHAARRRAASALVPLHAAYVLAVVWIVTYSTWVFARDVDTDPVGTWLLRLMTLGPLLIAVVVASPLLAWLIVLAVHLWRGRPWARTAGILTFGLIVAGLGASAIDAGMTWRNAALLALVTAPSLGGMWILLTGKNAFTPPSAATPAEAGP